MNKKKILTVIMAGSLIAGCTEQPPQLSADNIDEVIKAMTLEEKASLLYGTGMEGATGMECVVGENEKIIPGAAGTTHGIERLGIPEIVLADGPAGLRIKPIRTNSDKTYYCTAFPIATLLASTWNTSLVEKVGDAIGNETHEYGVDVILSPGVNIHRNPLCGRNYEYYSEDPLLAGKMASALIKGIQNNNVGTSIKHFAVNNQETNRSNNDARVSKRALREIYLKPFEIAIKESNPWTVMTSYNKINGVYSSHSNDLLENLLRGEWNYDGLVMTDWFGGNDPVAQMNAGNDLLMPGVPSQYDAIIAAVKEGKLDEKVLDRNIKRILQLVVKSPRFNKYKFSDNPDLESHAEITRQCAAEGTILLENKNNALPLQNVKKIAVFGITSYNFISGGTGSGDVNEKYTVSLTEGLQNVGIEIDENLNKIYIEELKRQKEIFDKNADNKDSMVFRFKPEDLIDFSGKIDGYVKSNDAAVITLGRVSGEFKDRRISDFYLSDGEKKLINDVSKAFKSKNKKTIVILNVGGVIETASWKDLPDAIILPWMGGQEGGNAVADVMLGKVSPSGRLPMTFPIDYFDVPSAKNFPYDIEPTPFTLFNVPDSTRQEQETVDFTNYTEDVFVGYRHYLTENKAVAYPFGYGLSFTQFKYENLSAKLDGDNIIINFSVKNVGTKSGKQVAQVYVSAPLTPSSSYRKPTAELKAFAKTKELAPNESQDFSLVITPYDLASYHEDITAWKTDVGKYLIKIANNAADLQNAVSAELVIEKELIYKTKNLL